MALSASTFFGSSLAFSVCNAFLCSSALESRFCFMVSRNLNSSSIFSSNASLAVCCARLTIPPNGSGGTWFCGAGDVILFYALFCVCCAAGVCGVGDLTCG